MTQLDVPEHLVPALTRMLAMSAKKRSDYSRTGAWANFHDTSAFFGLAPWQSAVFNQIQKLSRVRSLSDGREIKNEPLEDTLLDNANYALFAYAMYLEQAAITEANLPINADGTYECCGGELGSHVRGCIHLSGLRNELG